MTSETMEKARIIYLRAKQSLTPLARTGIKLLWGFDHCISCGAKPFSEPDQKRLGFKHPPAIEDAVRELWPQVRRSTDKW